MPNASRMSEGIVVQGLSEIFLNFDPLTSHWGNVWRYRRGIADKRGYNAWDDDCDCGRPTMAHHHSLCSVSPIYANMCSEFGIPRMDVPMSLLTTSKFVGQIAATAVQGLAETFDVAL